MLTKLNSKTDIGSFSEKIDFLESEMLNMPQADCPVVHRFGPGIYIREVTLLAGTFAVGHYQKTDHLNVMIKGKVLMVNDDGSRTVLEAPQTFVGKPGRKVGYIIEEVLWQNIYATTETDIDKLEETYLIKSDTYKLKESERKAIEYTASAVSRLDFNKMLDDTGFDEVTVREQSENEDDMIDMPGPVHPYRIADSAIEGKGYFLTVPAKAGAILAPARIKDKRTPAGRFVNHSCAPNAKMAHAENGNIYLVALTDIKGCVGGYMGDEVTIDYREAVRLVTHLTKAGALCQV